MATRMMARSRRRRSLVGEIVGVSRVSRAWIECGMRAGVSWRWKRGVDTRTGMDVVAGCANGEKVRWRLGMIAVRSERACARVRGSAGAERRGACEGTVEARAIELERRANAW